MLSFAESTAGGMTLDRDGAELFKAAVNAEALGAIRRLLSGQLTDRAGVRLHGLADLRPFIEVGGPLGRLALSRMKGASRPVRAILFDKTASANWSLAWHQDRVIAVRERIEVAGFGPWTRKGGVQHVAPPFGILAGMITLRLHLDAVAETNAPLMIAPGSHRFGRIAERDVAQVVERCGIAACLAEAGDAWLYATPILHGSAPARQPAHRRVLQIDYAVGDLPGGLHWLGV